MIQCKICQREFSRLITNTHLRTHQTTLEAYQEIFGMGSAVAPEYRLEKMKARDENTRRKISSGMKKYATEHKAEMKRRAKKAIQTKIKNGQDLAFFSGKTHTDKSKKMISLNKIRK